MKISEYISFRYVFDCPIRVLLLVWVCDALIYIIVVLERLLRVINVVEWIFGHGSLPT